MNYIEAKQEFIQTWGTLGNHWGITRTMSQIHALLLLSPDPLSTEEIMLELSISRGNTNMNVRDLMDWGLVHKVLKQGERKEYFQAEKDIWKVATQVAKERKKRELDPLIQTLEKLIVEDIQDVAINADKSITRMVNAEQHWFWNSMLKIFK
ncbi:MAG: transcriptional regulator [Bacteroidetes bacterium]|nr:transcriptional regulator [Bacteroidota bacterium]